MKEKRKQEKEQRLRDKQDTKLKVKLPPPAKRRKFGNKNLQTGITNEDSKENHTECSQKENIAPARKSLQ